MAVRAVPAKSPNPETCIVVDDVSWETYELLLRDLQEEHLRLTYDRGTLAIDRRGTEVGALEPISRETYESLLRDIGDGNTRLTFDGRRLSIVSPTQRHDRVKSLIAGMAEVLAMELRIPMSRYGSSTWRPEDGAKGMEADECYYVQNEKHVRGKDQIDLTVDPPPDLVVEVEVTNPPVKRLPILVALGVREVWHWRGDELRALKLEGDAFVPTEFSLAFPMLKVAELNRFLRMRHSTDETSIMVSFQEWVRTLK